MTQHGQPIALPGPLCLGAGRFSGFGFFAAMTPGAS
jgi:hypothetical protein